MNQKLDVNLLSTVLLNKFKHDKSVSDRLGEVLRVEMDMPAQSSVDSGIMENFYTHISKIMAARLLENNRSIQLIQVDDLDELLLEIALKSENLEPFSPESFAIFIKPVLVGLIETLLEMADGSSPYDYYWKLINTIVALAEDELLSLDQALDPDQYDEVTRRIYTRGQYLSQSSIVFKLLANPEKLVKSMADPMLDSMDLEPDEREAIEDEIYLAIENQLKPKFEKMVKIFQKLLDKEMDRIYS